MLRKTLVICLPLLAFAACKADSKKSNSPVNPTAVTDAIQGNNSALETKGETTPPGVTQPTQGTVTVPGANDGKGGGSDGDSSGQNQNQNQNGPTTPENKPECETLVIDFDNTPAGKLNSNDTLNEQYKNYGISFISHKNLDNGTTVTNAKPVVVPTPKTGLASTPDQQNARGGYVKLLFKDPTSIISADFVDVDNNSSNIELFTTNDHVHYTRNSTQAIPQRADRETQTLSVDDHSYIHKMTIKFTGSSAVDNIKICVKK